MSNHKVQKYFALYKILLSFAFMEINNAIETLLLSTPFKEKAKEKNKEGGKLRMFVTRYQRGEVKTGSAIDLLESFGYKIDIEEPRL